MNFTYCEISEGRTVKSNKLQLNNEYTSLLKMDYQVSSQNTLTFSLDYVYMLATELYYQFSENAAKGILSKSIFKKM